MQKFFWEDPYLTKLTSKVTQCSENGVILDRTIIYSFSGGQESDEATINGAKVLASTILDSKEIIYKLENSPMLVVGEEVVSEINWDKRYKIMKLHSATHMALAAFNDLVGVHQIIGANVTSEKGRIDFLYSEPITSLIVEIQKIIDQVIWEDVEIITKFNNPFNDPEQRLWIIENRSENWSIGCGGTHPKQSREIGSLKLKRENIGKGKERLEIKLIN